VAVPGNLIAGGPARLQLGDLSIVGRSRAGEESWFRLSPPGIAFDVGRGAPELEGCARLFLTHGHLDHCLGLPFVLSRRAAAAAGPTIAHAPAPASERVREFVGAAERLEERSYDWRLVAMSPGDRAEIDDRHTVEAFAVAHGVASLGYLLLRRRRRLSAAWRGRPPEEIAAARRSGVEVEETVEATWLGYCGDSGPDVFALEPRLLTVPILLIECTFLDSDRRENARRYGHLHFDDLVARAADLRNEAIVLVHLSRRHSVAELRRSVAERLPGLAERVHVFAVGE
jgi:ribonuclease Z